MTRLLLALAALLALAGPAAAHDMNKPDLNAWYESLEHPRLGNCCDKTDCKETSYRIGHDGYEVMIDERFPGVKQSRWVKVPDDAVLSRENPTGSGVACWYANSVRCFVPLAEG